MLNEFELKILNLISKKDYISLKSHIKSKIKLCNLSLLSYEGLGIYKITEKGLNYLKNVRSSD